MLLFERMDGLKSETGFVYITLTFENKLRKREENSACQKRGLKAVIKSCTPDKGKCSLAVCFVQGRIKRSFLKGYDRVSVRIGSLFRLFRRGWMLR
jgi:hypothetical protein